MKAGTAEALTTALKTNFVGIYEYVSRNKGLCEGR
jgi:hypothetical protein